MFTEEVTRVPLNPVEFKLPQLILLEEDLKFCPKYSIFLM